MLQFSFRIRIVLIGSTGSGKSSLGNTLLGEDHFHESAAAKSVTSKCEIGESHVGNRKIKVADTPGFVNADGENMASVLENFFDFLSPGPHAIIIVLAPNRESNLERRALSGLREFFGDNKFLDYTMIVMVRKNDIIGEFGESETIQDFIENNSAETVRQLYAECNKRIVLVENKQKMTERQKDAECVFAEIDKMDGYYSQSYFQLLANVKTKEATIISLQQMIKELELRKSYEEKLVEQQQKHDAHLVELQKKRDASYCNIM